MRARMRNIIRRRGSQCLYRRLQILDPASASRISNADGERIIRAYEVFLLTGKTMDWWQQQPRDALHGFCWLKIGIDVPRERLYARINQRVVEMFERGLLDEVQALKAQFPREAHAFKAIGYRQAMDYLDGLLTLQDAIADTQLQSRHYAKRQMTWFRADKSIVWLEGEDDWAVLQKKASAMIEEFLGKTEAASRPN